MQTPETPKNDSVKSLKTTVTVEVSLPEVGTVIRRNVPLSEADASRLRDHLLDRGTCSATLDPMVAELHLPPGTKTVVTGPPSIGISVGNLRGATKATFNSGGGAGLSRDAVPPEDLAGISPDRLRPATLGECEGPSIPLDGTLREVVGPAITNAKAAAKINFPEEGRPRKLPEPTPLPAGPHVVIVGPGYRAVEPPNIVRIGLSEGPQIPRTPNDAWPQPPSDWLEELKKEVTGWFEASADASPHGVVADRVTCVVRRKLGFKDYKDMTEMERKVATAFSIGLSRL